VQALDHATGYLLAAAAIRGLTRRLQTGVGCEARTSLARMAALLVSTEADDSAPDLESETPDDQSDLPEETSWGLACRLKPPLEVQGAPMYWDLPATRLGAAPAKWVNND